MPLARCPRRRGPASCRRTPGGGLVVGRGLMRSDRGRTSGQGNRRPRCHGRPLAIGPLRFPSAPRRPGEARRSSSPTPAPAQIPGGRGIPGRSDRRSIPMAVTEPPGPASTLAGRRSEGPTSSVRRRHRTPAGGRPRGGRASREAAAPWSTPRRRPRNQGPSAAGPATLFHRADRQSAGVIAEATANARARASSSAADSGARGGAASEPPIRACSRILARDDAPGRDGDGEILRPSAWRSVSTIDYYSRMTAWPARQP